MDLGRPPERKAGFGLKVMKPAAKAPAAMGSAVNRPQTPPLHTHLCTRPSPVVASSAVPTTRLVYLTFSHPDLFGPQMASAFGGDSSSDEEGGASVRSARKPASKPPPSLPPESSALSPSRPVSVRLVGLRQPAVAVSHHGGEGTESMQYDAHGTPRGI